MKKIFVIGSAHAEGGACTSNALLQIIERIAPDTIFCEASPQDFQAMLEARETFNTPEINVLRTIRARGSIEIVPIDVNENPFDGRLEAMYQLFKRNREYYCASEIQAGETYRLGFPYLNSRDCDKIQRDKSYIERIFVTRANHPKLSKMYRDWGSWNDKRENHWIDRVYNQFETNKINTAVLLVGAAHRIGLMEKIESNAHEKYTLSWEFYPFDSA